MRSTFDTVMLTARTHVRSGNYDKARRELGKIRLRELSVTQQANVDGLDTVIDSLKGRHLRATTAFAKLLNGPITEYPNSVHARLNRDYAICLINQGDRGFRDMDFAHSAIQMAHALQANLGEGIEHAITNGFRGKALMRRKASEAEKIICATGEEIIRLAPAQSRLGVFIREKGALERLVNCKALVLLNSRQNGERAYVLIDAENKRRDISFPTDGR